MLRMPLGEGKGNRHMRVSEILTDSMMQVMDETALRFFGRTPKDAVEKGECVGCSEKVDITMHPHRLERYRICGMCSECQHDWMPDLFQEEVGTVIVPEDRVKKQTKDTRFLKSRSTLLKHWHVMENTTVKVLQKRSKLNASTIMTQIKHMMKEKEVNEILVNGRQTFTLMKEVEDELSEV
jgi:hypothetical protein